MRGATAGSVLIRVCVLCIQPTVALMRGIYQLAPETLAIGFRKICNRPCSFMTQINLRCAVSIVNATLSFFGQYDHFPCFRSPNIMPDVRRYKASAVVSRSSLPSSQLVHLKHRIALSSLSVVMPSFKLARTYLLANWFPAECTLDSVFDELLFGEERVKLDDKI